MIVAVEDLQPGDRFAGAGVVVEVIPSTSELRAPVVRLRRDGKVHFWAFPTGTRIEIDRPEPPVKRWRQVITRETSNEYIAKGWGNRSNNCDDIMTTKYGPVEEVTS